ncbi:MAG: DUF4907 domain-containing protein [Chitinophagaceae bacterium]
MNIRQHTVHCNAYDQKQPMKLSKHTITVLLISLLVSIAILAYKTRQQSVKKAARYSAEVFSVWNGWGYDILVNDSVIIHQESIPSIGKGIPFPEKVQAQQAANLVLKKLMDNDELPTLSHAEVAEICPSLK